MIRVEKRLICAALPVAALLLAAAIIVRPPQARAQDQPAQSSAQNSNSGTGNSTAEQNAQHSDQADQNRHSLGIGRELATEEREAQGDEEENSKLKHSPVVQKLAKITGLSVHGAHLLALWVNFGIIVLVVVWAGRKALPAIFRSRNESIQRALEEARKTSEEAQRRLADIESRLKQMDVEIGKMQASAEKEAEAEEARIQKAAEDEMRRIVEAAEQEIAAAAKQARRELSIHTADLAITLARKQINVDTNTDQVLVRDFAAKLAGKTNGGKDGQ